MSSPLAALLAGNSASAKFPNPGTSYSGTVVRVDVKQQTDIKTRVPQWWDDQQTRPKEEIVVTVDTGVIDPTIENDTGHRGIYIKAWNPQLAAFKAAVVEAGARDVAVGDWFSATYTGDIPADKPGMSPTKMFTYQLRPASATATLLGTTTAPQAQQQAAAPAAQQPAAWPATVAYTPPAAPAAPAAPPPPAAPAAPAAPNPLDAMRGDVQQWIGAGWSAEQIADPAVGAAFPHAAQLATMRATGADVVAIVRQLAGQ